MKSESELLPTGAFGSWAVTALRDSLINRLGEDQHGESLDLYFYAVTLSGWQSVRKSIQKWRQRDAARCSTIYAGTDHGITDPDALSAMSDDGISVRLMQTYSGVYHPKVIRLSSPKSESIWVGSNNLTRDGLLNNIEFAVLIEGNAIPSSFLKWIKGVHAGSTALTDALLETYRQERTKFEKGRAAAKSTTFTWSQRSEPVKEAAQPKLRGGELIIEVMPEETRGGNQVQLPREAAKHLFGLKEAGDQVEIQLKQLGSAEYRKLVISVFANKTVRVSINDLEYRDRPCMIILHRKAPKKFEFEIIPESIFPSRYRSLLAACTNQTRAGSRRWTIA